MSAHLPSAPGKLPLDFNLFSKFATSALTHSGVWGWVLQSLDDDCPSEYHELRVPALALLAQIGVTGFQSPVTITRERRLAGVAGRVDIEAVDGTGRVVVFETKVKARPSEDQRRRYEDAYLAANHEVPCCVAILSTTFDEPWNYPGLLHVGAEDLLKILNLGEFESDVMIQYVAWLAAELESRRQGMVSVFGDRSEECASTLCSAAANGASCANWAN